MIRDILKNTRDWEQFRSKVRPLSKKEKGDAFEEFVKIYLQIDPNYRTKLKKVWLFREIDNSLKEFLNLPPKDAGIDMVAETFDGEFWAVQCKYSEDDRGSLNWKEISKFFALVSKRCRHISFALVCATKDRLTKVIEKEKDIGFRSNEEWRNLDTEFFKQAYELLQGKKARPRRRRPRPHQSRAIKNALDHFVAKKQERGKLIMPCGSGKSLAAYWIAQGLEARRIVVAVPSLALIRQTLKEWMSESIASRKRVHWICVASDESVTEAARDEVSVLRQDLGIPTITEPAEISKWLQRKHRGVVVVFTTYQSGRAVAEASRSVGLDYDLGIFDEAHKTVGQKDRLFAHLLFDDNIVMSRRLFMTATERRYRGDSDEIVSMDDEKLYGTTFELLSFKEAIDSGILTDYKIVTMIRPKAEIDELIRKNVYLIPQKSKSDREIEAETFAGALVLLKAQKKYGYRHAVSFHRSIHRAREFKAVCDLLPSLVQDMPKLSTYHVSGAMSTGTRDRELRSFAENEPSLVTNARCLTEGVDIPDIDCVFFADPKHSRVDIVQAVGRALRRNPRQEKQFAYVVLPIIKEEGQSREQFLESSPFDGLLTTLRALASQDERIIEYFRTYSTTRSLGANINLDVDERLRKETDEQDFSESINLRIWNKIARLSWRPFEEAREFVHGLHLENQYEWYQLVRGADSQHRTLPSDIPATPSIVYARTGWLNWGDWLGTGSMAHWLYVFLSFEKAREYARGLGLKNFAEWRAYARAGKLPRDVPRDPYRVYRGKGWISSGDWLGTDSNWKVGYRTFEEARGFAHGLKLNTHVEWMRYCRGEMSEKGKRPKDIPTNPQHKYLKDGWISWGDWLGTGRIAANDLEFLSFEEARRFARSLHLKTQQEWFRFTSGEMPHKGKLPSGIPVSPRGTYMGKGWISMGDWLGTGKIADQMIQYRAFDEGRKFARGLGLKTRADWLRYCKGLFSDKPKKPVDVPRKADQQYRNKGWISWNDWLGVQMSFRPFEQARSFVRQLALSNVSQWRLYCGGLMTGKEPLPDDIPRNPWSVYKKAGWVNLSDWLGFDTEAPMYRPFIEARDYVQHLRLKNLSEWRMLCKGRVSDLKPLPNDIPHDPQKVYRAQGWKDFRDWLHAKEEARSRYLPFEDARRFAQSLSLRSLNEWRTYCTGKTAGKKAKPNGVPACPWLVYQASGWKGIKDWLGVPEKFLSFEDAKTQVRRLNLKSTREWRVFCRGEMPEKGMPPTVVPFNPDQVYKKKGWQGWGDWLGTFAIAPYNRVYPPFEEAHRFARSLKLTNIDEWRRFCKGEMPEKGKLPENMTASPHKTYLNKGWISVGDWLGTGSIANTRKSKMFLPFVDARTFVRRLGLKSQKEWHLYCSGKTPSKKPKPQDIPRNPGQVYAQLGWKGFGDWLGTGRIADQDRVFREFESARKFVHGLALKSKTEWFKYCKGQIGLRGRKPDDIPANPAKSYARRGWVSWADWLGNE